MYFFFFFFEQVANYFQASIQGTFQIQCLYINISRKQKLLKLDQIILSNENKIMKLKSRIHI